MKYTPTLLIILAFSFIACAPSNDPNKEEWIALFNGKDLTGWIPKIRGYETGENFGETFKADSGRIQVNYHAYDSFRQRYGHLFYKDKFSHYRLVVEYRFIGKQCAGGEGWATRNSGAMLHSQDPTSMLKDQDFPISIEAQFLGGLGDGPRSTANLCTPGTHVRFADTLFIPHCINAQSKTYDGDQWVHVEFLVLGDSLIRHTVEGETVLEYTKPEIGGGVVNGYDSLVKIDGKSLAEGFIALQSESHPIEFRKVELLNLKGCKDPKAKNYKSYLVSEDSSTCLYQ
ncbi:MAG: DUF1080 domain-containing protein [Bacteroidetes bacterium]|nr:DUF1080 domain-containing protein [Bacteroidota bacterium]